MNAGGICVSLQRQSVSPGAAWLGGLFQVHADFRAADNPTVTTSDYMELMYA